MPIPRQTTTQLIRSESERASSTPSRSGADAGPILGLPLALWSRLLVLLMALGTIKVWLISTQSKLLYETHWRLAGAPSSWLDGAAFYLFIGLGILSLGFLGEQCRRTGVKTVRAANVGVLFLALLFILLTLHSGENNYLYPVMTGLLNWSSLLPYLSLDLFFHAPFLAGWLLGYGFLYYLLARTGREGWVLHLTAITAGAFGMVNLRDLLGYRNDLLVADCFGVAVLAARGLSNRPFRSAWLLVPASWTAFYWIVFYRVSAELHDLNPYFVMLVGEILVVFGALALWAKQQKFYSAWVQFGLFYLVAFLLVSNSNYPSSGNYDHLLCLAFEAPRYFIGEILLVGVLAVGAGVYLKMRPRARFWWLDVVSLLFIVVSVVDLRLCQVMGVRLEWNVLAFGDSPKMMWRLAKPYLPGVALILVLLLAAYIIGIWVVSAFLRSRVCVKHPSQSEVAPVASARFGVPQFCDRGFWYVVASFIALAILGKGLADPDKVQGQAAVRLALSSPVWHRVTTRTMDPEEFYKRSAELGLGQLTPTAAITSAQAPRQLNVVLVFMESSYNRHLSLFGSDEETQPLLSQYKDRMELFPNFFSVFAGSIHARFASFTSLYPVREFETFTSHRVGVKSLFEALHDQGYSCSLFYSSFFTYTGFGDFLKNRGLDEMYDAETMPGSRSTAPIAWGLREEETLGAMKNQIRKYAETKKRFFLTYVPAAPHFPYDDIPKQFQKHKLDVVGDCTPRYLNALLYMDWVISSLIEQLKDSSLLDQTLVVITNDHGEMLGGGDGPIGHGWAVTPQLVNTPLIVMDPQNPGAHTNYVVGTQVDLLPTLLDRLKISLPGGQIYQGHSLDSSTNQEGGFRYLNSYRQYAVLAGHHIYVGDRETASSIPSKNAKGVYELHNNGTKTLFNKDPASDFPQLSIGHFDQFQENFLRNYEFYCTSLCDSLSGKLKPKSEVAVMKHN